MSIDTLKALVKVPELRCVITFVALATMIGACTFLQNTCVAATYVTSSGLVAEGRFCGVQGVTGPVVVEDVGGSDALPE
jgi:hypothetical protein